MIFIFGCTTGTKDAALREAKLTYLKNAPESIAANPYFWAGFVPMGNMDAMDMTEKGPLSIFWILAGLLAISGLGFYFFKKTKMSVSHLEGFRGARNVRKI